MASNIEEFLLKFVFDDGDSIKKIKKFTKDITNLENVSSKHSRHQKLRSKAEEAALKRRIALKKKLAAVKPRSPRQRPEFDPANDPRLRAVRRSANFRDLISGGDRERDFAARSLSNMQKELAKGTKASTEAFKDQKAALARVAREYRKVNREALGLKTAQKGLTDSTRNMIRGYASLFAVFEGTTAINQVGQDFEGMRAAMLASSGTAEKAVEDLAFVRSEAVRLGLDLRDTTNAFVKLQFAAQGKMETSEVRELLSGFSEFATAMQVDKFRFEKSLLALTQIKYIHCLPV